ncbi:MAG: hypothetical protein JWR01_1303 [Subtercola sp.]|nr:hypothetical protein [Subtercola sp.]
MNEHTPTPDIETPENTVEVTRFEETLQVSTHTVPVSIARLEKFIVTEQKTFTIDVRREDVRLSTEPITELTPQPLPTGEPDEIEIVLYEERITITRELVPVERVKLTKKLITVHQPITDTVRKERIDVTTEPAAGHPAQPTA